MQIKTSTHTYGPVGGRLRLTCVGQMFGNRQWDVRCPGRRLRALHKTRKTWARCRETSGLSARNRRPTDFVGPDLRELQRFIGILQATPRGHVTPADRRTSPPRRSVGNHESATRQRTRRGQMYYPRWRSISLLPRLPPQPGSLESNALDTLARSPQLSGSSRIAVLVEGRTAILRGEVPSAKDRDLAEVATVF